MLETPEARAKLRRKLETWPDDRKSPVTINQGLELLDLVEKLEKEANWLAEKLAEASGSMFDDEMKDLGFECSQECEQSGCTLECRKNNWLESARKALEQEK